MTDAVVDSSVAVKWFVPEEDTLEAEAFQGRQLRLHAPDFLRIELANALWKHTLRGNIRGDTFSPSLSELMRSIDQWHPAGDLVEAAYALAMVLEHPIYDCLYLALAQTISAPLVTADRRLIAKTAGLSDIVRVVALPHWHSAFPA